MIPAKIDHLSILQDLKGMGWLDFKIELACGFASGYVSQLKCGNIQDMSYARAARLYNFWESERDLQTRLNPTVSAESPIPSGDGASIRLST